MPHKYTSNDRYTIITRKDELFLVKAWISLGCDMSRMCKLTLELPVVLPNRKIISNE